LKEKEEKQNNTSVRHRMCDCIYKGLKLDRTAKYLKAHIVHTVRLAIEKAIVDNKF
jgi:hypothetical protein